jgi:hypothetical protein
MKKILLLFVFGCWLFPSYSQTTKWTTNFGLEVGSDFYGGLEGLSTLKKADNPLVNNDLQNKYAVSTGFYAEFLQLRKREDTKWGAIAPGFGIKTKVEWQFFRADNSSNGGGESFGLNQINVPLLFEYYTGYHQGITRAGRTPTTTTYRGQGNSDGSYSVTENTTGGNYYAGGDQTSGGSFIYFGPQICHIFKSFNYTGDPIINPNLVNDYVGLVGGYAFCMHQINFDFSYQKGMTSIYKGKNITEDGFMLKIALNFSSRLYNK